MKVRYKDGLMLRTHDHHDPTKLSPMHDMPRTFEMFAEKAKRLGSGMESESSGSEETR